jgi:selenocysteine lyase/cysteine desulfurase
MGYEDLEVLRDEFPVTRELIYLNHASIAPLCRSAVEAMKFLADDAAQFGSLHYDTWLEAYAGLREATARLVGAEAGEIAIVKNTSEGISVVALGFPWKLGDRIVAFREEFPANALPWQRLEARGVQISWLSIYDSLEDIEAAIAGARLLAISFVNYLSGFRVDLKTIGECCRKHGCFFFVDAIQGLGVFPLDVQEFRIDALSADGHKWLLGPEGNGILYIRREWHDRIEPVEFGWTNRKAANDYSSRDLTLRSDAGRYECGTLNTIGCFGLRAAIDFLLNIGVARIGTGVNEITQRLECGIARRGYRLLHARNSEQGSGIISAKHPSLDSRVIARNLKDTGIVVATRGEWLRFSPHFYINESEIDCVIESLPGV